MRRARYATSCDMAFSPKVVSAPFPTSPATVFIVDDQPSGRRLLTEIIKRVDDGVTINVFDSSEDAYQATISNTPTLIITDHYMEPFDGIELIRRIRRLPHCRTLPLMMITVAHDVSVRHEALKVGATDFLTRPVDHVECVARCRNLIQLYRQQEIIVRRAAWLEDEYARSSEDTRRRDRDTVARLAGALDQRLNHHGQRRQRMSKLANILTSEYGMSDAEKELYGEAAAIYDIGKISLPDGLLSSKSRHNRAQHAIIRTHCESGYKILRDSPSPFLQIAAEASLYHHERFDGSGYPFGLQDESIPLSGRIMAVLDVMDALVQARPHRPAYLPSDALRFICKQGGQWFDPSITAVVEDSFDLFEAALSSTAN